MKHIIILTILIISFHNAFADEFRFRSSFENESFKAELKNGYWILSEKSTKSKRAKIKDCGFGAMTMLISKNGENIVVIDDFSVGTEPIDRELIWIYKNGKQFKTYRLSEIIEDKCNVSISVSHISWCLENFKLDSEKNIFSFSTYEMFRYKIDLDSGNIILRTRPEGFNDETIIAYGLLRKVQDKKYLMKDMRILTKNLAGQESIEFDSNNSGFENQKRLMMIKNGIDITPVDYLLEPIWLSECKD